MPPKLSVSALVNAFEGTSSRMLRGNRPDIAARDRGRCLVVAGLFRCVGGDPSAIIKQMSSNRQRTLALPWLSGAEKLVTTRALLFPSRGVTLHDTPSPTNLPRLLSLTAGSLSPPQCSLHSPRHRRYYA
jgi:hypothetical protein